MGTLFSKNRNEGSSHNALTSPDSQVTPPDLSSYEAACRLDPDLQSFDSTLRDRTSRVISSLAATVEVRSLSLDSLREVTDSFLETNQEVVKVILDSKEDIWNNSQLFDVVKDYFDTSLQTLDFCTALDKCLKRARDSQFVIQVALQQFDEEQKNEADGKKLYLKTLQELKNFKVGGGPFTDEFFLLFQSVYSKQVSMLQRLQKEKMKMDKKLKRVKVMRRVSMIIFAATFASVLICSVVAAAIAAPPVLTALAAAVAVPLGSMGKWLNSIWRKYENEVKGRRDIIGSMQIGTYIAIKDLDSIHVLVQKLEIEIEGLLQNAEFAIIEEEEAVVIAMEEIKKKSGGFMKTIEDLGERTDKCSRDVRRARTVILQTIIKYPGSST